MTYLKISGQVILIQSQLMVTHITNIVWDWCFYDKDEVEGKYDNYNLYCYLY